MREIKFRAWLKNVGIMLSVYVLDQTGNAGMGTHFEKSKGYGEHGGQFVFNIDDAELMQYTGLKDKNGKEIYESDICQIHYYHDKSIPSVIGVVDWVDSGFSIRAVKNIDEKAITGMYSLRFKSGGAYGDNHAVEVIGNIHEHKHLLQ